MVAFNALWEHWLRRHWWWDCSSNIIYIISLKLNYDFINHNSLKSKRQEPQKTEGGTANVPGDITGKEPELCIRFISDTRGYSQGRSGLPEMEEII